MSNKRASAPRVDVILLDGARIASIMGKALHLTRVVILAVIAAGGAFCVVLACSIYGHPANMVSLASFLIGTATLFILKRRAELGESETSPNVINEHGIFAASGFYTAGVASNLLLWHVDKLSETGLGLSIGGGAGVVIALTTFVLLDT